jgi:hypothetical protein
MRLGLAILGALLVIGTTGTASADRQAVSSWAAPAAELTLLDGWRARDSRVELGRAESKRGETAEPGQELSQAVGRMWSQVRAYKRPGGGELIVRGRF